MGGARKITIGSSRVNTFFLQVESLLRDPSIVRNRSKVNAFIQNAQCYLEVQKEFQTFDTYIWDFVGGPYC